MESAYQWVARGIKLQPALSRPIIDLHHIGVFFIWHVLKNVNDQDAITSYFYELAGRLFLRRTGINATGIPFIEGGNRLESVGEAVATYQIPDNYTDSTSYLVMMLLELCFSLDKERCAELLKDIQRQVIEGKTDPKGEPPDGTKRLTLQDWIVPDGWLEHVFSKSLQNKGISIMDPYIGVFEDDTKRSLLEAIPEYVKMVNEKYPVNRESKVSAAAIVLACIKHKTPLPSFFWRELVFPCNASQ